MKAKGDYIMEKMTNAKALGFVLGLEEVKANVEIMEKLTKMLEQVNKKNSSSVGADGKKVLSATQKVNDEIMAKIVTTLEEREVQEPIQIKEFMENAWVKEKEYTNQKMSALFKKLVDNGTLERVVEKRVTKFKLV